MSTPASRPLAVKTLLDLGACADQVKSLRRVIGRELSVDVTVALCVEHAAKFNWFWASNNLLSAKARATFGKTEIQAITAFDASTATAITAYDASVAPGRALAVSRLSIAMASAAYKAATAEARATCMAALAMAFAEAYIGDAG